MCSTRGTLLKSDLSDCRFETSGSSGLKSLPQEKNKLQGGDGAIMVSVIWKVLSCQTFAENLLSEEVQNLDLIQS